MNKVFTLPANEDWIVDRLCREWNEDNSDISANSPYEADVLWLFASWCWRNVPQDLLRRKKVVVTVHHIVPEKFDQNRIRDFLDRDQYVSLYHVYNKETHDIVSSLTKKTVQILPYWANHNLWKKSDESKDSLRRKYKLPSDAYMIGSFQRDTEGSDLKTPKLEKGPDLFIEYVKKVNENKHGVHVALGGWRRQYVISRLEELKIPYTYFDRPPQKVLNDLYQTLDIYPVTSRHEGGPQSIIECGLLGIPVVSRQVGIATQVLPEKSINDDVFCAIPDVPNVEKWKLPEGYNPYRKIFGEL